MVDHESVKFSLKEQGRSSSSLFRHSQSFNGDLGHTHGFFCPLHLFTFALSAYIEGDFFFWICATSEHPMGQYFFFGSFDHQFLIPITRYPWRFLSIFWGVYRQGEDQAGCLVVFSRMICLYNDSLCVLYPSPFLGSICYEAGRVVCFYLSLGSV